MKIDASAYGVTELTTAESSEISGGFFWFALGAVAVGLTASVIVASIYLADAMKHHKLLRSMTGT
ncbi:hypothetical protein NKH09_23830 [Mesorhizobium sp. M1339]|uniref:hypothetical protein n=1 Tax=unclassified Mesorhizobium TaxID=325217 RepID=UPI00333B2FAB